MEKAVYNLKTGAFFYPNVQDTSYANLVSPLSSWDNNVNLDESTKLMRHFNANPQFSHILYDEFRDVFYQFIYYPENKLKGFETLILVLDSTLELSKQFRFDNKYTADGAFVTKEGLSMLNLLKYKEDDSKSVFDTFLLVD